MLQRGRARHGTLKLSLHAAESLNFISGWPSFFNWPTQHKTPTVRDRKAREPAVYKQIRLKAGLWDKELFKNHLKTTAFLNPPGDSVKRWRRSPPHSALLPHAPSIANICLIDKQTVSASHAARPGVAWGIQGLYEPSGIRYNPSAFTATQESRVLIRTDLDSLRFILSHQSLPWVTR